MRITITGRHVDVTEAMREHARERLERLADNFARLTHVEATLDIDNAKHAVELVAKIARGAPHVVRARTADMYSAIDAAADKLEAQLRKEKEKVKERRIHRSGKELGGAPVA